MPLNLTPVEVETRFGPLKDTRGVFRQFDDPDTGGIWRPLFVGTDLVGYRHYLPPRPGKKMVWRPGRR